MLFLIIILIFCFIITVLVGAKLIISSFLVGERFGYKRKKTMSPFHLTLSSYAEEDGYYFGCVEESEQSLTENSDTQNHHFYVCGKYFVNKKDIK